MDRARAEHWKALSRAGDPDRRINATEADFNAGYRAALAVREERRADTLLLLRCPDCGVYTDRERGQDERCFHAGHGKPQEVRARACGVCHGRDRGTTTGPDGSPMPVVCGACEVEELPGDPLKDFALAVHRLNVDWEGAAHNCGDEKCKGDCSAVREVQATLDRVLGTHRLPELPGDGQRQEAPLTRAVSACCEAWIDIKPGGYHCSACGMVCGKTAPVVRDTEREHEPPAEAIEAYLARRVFEEKERAEKAERHAEVLAEALDEFFAAMKPHRQEAPVYRLKLTVEPTLQALGYGKGKTA